MVIIIRNDRVSVCIRYQVAGFGKVGMSITPNFPRALACKGTSRGSQIEDCMHTIMVRVSKWRITVQLQRRDGLEMKFRSISESLPLGMCVF